MTRKIIIGVLIAAAVGTIAYLYFQLTRSEGNYTDSVRGVPATMTLIGEFQPNQLNGSELALIESLSAIQNGMGDVSFNPVSEWGGVIHELMNLKSYQPAWTTLLEHSTVVLSTSEPYRGDAWLLTIGLMPNTSRSSVDEWMFAWKSEKGFSNRAFHDITISSNEKIQYAVVGSYLMASSSGALMEDAIIQHEKANLLSKDESFSKILEVKSADNFFNLFTKSGEQGWLQLNPEKKGSQWALSGYLMPGDSTYHSYAVSGEGAASMIAQVLPATTMLVDAYAFRNFDLLWEAQEFAASSSAQTEQNYWSQAWKDLGDSCQCDLNDLMLSWRNGEAGAALVSNADSTTSELLYFGVKDSIQVTNYMGQLLRPYAGEPGVIYEIRYPALFDRNKSRTFLVEANYLAQKGGFVFVAGSADDLRSVLRSTSTLQSQADYTTALKSLGGQPSRFTYQTTFYTSALPSGITGVLKGLPWIGASAEIFKDGKHLIQITLPIEVQADPSDEAQPETSGETTQDTSVQATSTLSDALRGPWAVINHTNQEKEQLYQNRSKEICLVGSNGAVLWKTPISSEIIGEVTQIDALKNGKLQYAFVAGSQLHIIDRNGTSLQSFPVSLGSPASSGLFVFDYDGSKNYRMISGSEDGALHNHNAQGKMNEGWKYAGSVPIAWVKHIKVGTDDVLVAISHAGSVQLLKRNGEKKLDTSTTLTDWNGGDFKIQSAGMLKDIKITFTTKSGEQKTVGV